VERGQHSREWVHCARFVIQFSPIFPASASIFRAFHSLIDGGAGAAGRGLEIKNSGLPGNQIKRVAFDTLSRGS